MQNHGRANIRNVGQCPPNRLLTVAGQKIIATKLYRTESPPKFIYSNGKGKILIKPTKEMKRTKMVFATKFGFGSRLSKGKVLAPLTSIVLDGTHLVILVINC